MLAKMYVVICGSAKRIRHMREAHVLVCIHAAGEREGAKGLFCCTHSCMLLLFGWEVGR